MKIAFLGKNAATFLPGFKEQLRSPATIAVLPDRLETEADRQALSEADVVIGVRYSSDMPRLGASLFQLPAAGYDGVDFSAVPSSCTVCNAFGHEQAIAEYVMAALLARHVPVADADARLRRGDWHYRAGGPVGLRTEMGSQRIGIIGHGHIGREVAHRALAFGMKVQVANRSPVAQPAYERVWGMSALREMASQVDIVLNTLPLTEETRGLVGAEVLAAMQPHAIIMNVGRGPVIDEASLFSALSSGQIGGAILDTWYVYPNEGNPAPMPGTLPFQTLPNVVMTPHMSGWTEGTVRRRTNTCAENVNRLAAGRDLANIVGKGLA